MYKKRWRIECFFQNVKKRGFNLEPTHLKDLDKLKKLVGLVSIAYAVVANIGLHTCLKGEGIPVKNHGYKAPAKESTSSVKGLDEIGNGTSIFSSTGSFVSCDGCSLIPIIYLCPNFSTVVKRKRYFPGCPNSKLPLNKA